MLSAYGSAPMAGVRHERLPRIDRILSVDRLAEGAQDAGQGRTVGGRQGAEYPVGLGAAGDADRLAGLLAGGGQLDPGGPAVLRVGPADDEGPLLQLVDHLGRRAGR